MERGSSGVRSAVHAAILTLAVSLASCGHSGTGLAGVPSLDHVVVVVMENKSYDEARAGPYVASLLTQGASFTRSYAVAHPSQPNYVALWSGSTQNIASDACPPPASPFAAENLGHAVEAHQRTWRAYVENLPSPGATACSAGLGLYVRTHAPWTNFSNVNHADERPLGDLDQDIAAGRLPNLAFVIPNTCHDSHSCDAAHGDAWLADRVPALVGAVGPHGVVIVTWDEDDSGMGNHILTVFVGAPVRAGAVSSRTITHYTVLSTICAVLGIPAFGSAVHEPPITDIWQPRTPASMVRGPEIRARRPAPAALRPSASG